jgi:hypothetical protein
MSKRNKRKSMSAAGTESSSLSSDGSNGDSDGGRDGSSSDFDGDDGQSSMDSNGGSANAQERIADAARNAASGAKRQAESLYQGASSTAAETSDAIDDAADVFERSGHETLSQAASALSERVRNFSHYLEDRKLEDLVGDARRLAQRNPGVFIAGGMALGFALSRFLRANAADASRTNRNV